MADTLVKVRRRHGAACSGRDCRCRYRLELYRPRVGCGHHEGIVAVTPLNTSVPPLEKWRKDAIADAAGVDRVVAGAIDNSKIADTGSCNHPVVNVTTFPPLAGSISSTLVTPANWLAVIVPAAVTAERQ